MNKLPLSIISVLMSLSAHASFYAGLNLGAGSIEVEHQLNFPLEDEDQTYTRYTNGYTGVHGQIFLGYEHQFTSSFGGALEIGVGQYFGKSEYSIREWYFEENAYTRESLKHSVNAFVLPSFKYNDYLTLFAGPGVSSTQFTTSSLNTAANIGVSGSYDRWLTGMAGKVGANVKLTAQTDLVLSYQYNHYNSVTWSNVEPLSEESLQGRYQPDSGLALVGLRIHS